MGEDGSDVGSILEGDAGDDAWEEDHRGWQRNKRESSGFRRLCHGAGQLCLHAIEEKRSGRAWDYTYDSPGGGTSST